MDINKIIDMSKSMMLDLGKHWPTVYVELKGDPQWQCCLCADLVTIKETSEKCKALFAGGAALSKRNSSKEIAQVCFVNEAWQSSYTSREQIKHAPPPSEDPNRKEALIVVMLDLEASPPVQIGQAFEIIRPGGGIDLLPQAGPHEMRTDFLVSFVAGFRSATLSEKELYDFVAKIAPDQSRQVRRALLRDLQKLSNRAKLMDVEEYKAHRGGY